MFSLSQYPNLVPPVIIFLLAFFICFYATRVVRWLAARLGILDHPGARKRQDKPVPCAGGVGLVVAVVLSLLLAYALTDDLDASDSQDLPLILAVGVGLAVVGLLDDVFSVRATVKLMVLAVGCYVLSSRGIGVNRTPYPVLNYMLTFLWVAGVASAFNAIDNMDGVAGGICLICAVTLFLMGWSTWQVRFSLLAMALAGASLGFLHHNWPPARIYLGDSGSFFLGYILAVLVIFGEWSEDPRRSLLSGIAVVALPIYDLALTTVLRIRHGVVRNPIEAIAHSDLDHTSHRLRRLGLSSPRALALLYALNIACCLLALLASQEAWAWPWVATAFGGALLFAIALGWHLDRKTSHPDLWVGTTS